MSPCVGVSSGSFKRVALCCLVSFSVVVFADVCYVVFVQYVSVFLDCLVRLAEYYSVFGNS